MQKGIPVTRAPIGVGVLKMVNARSAGVLLTVIPASGDRSKVIIEGNWGLGEIVVAGDSTPDTFIVDKATFKCDVTLNPKQKRVVYAGQGTTVEDVPGDLQNTPCLKAQEVEKLVETGCFVEHYFGEPQDMEWAIDASLPFPDNIYWLQTRPAKWVKKEGAKEYFTDLMGGVFK
jgi:pyruvate,water dikinase